MMQRIVIVIAALVFSSAVFAEWRNASEVVVVQFYPTGLVRFVVKDNDGSELKCVGDQVWHKLKSCSETDSQCISAVNRQASMLLSAKMARKRIEFGRGDGTQSCEVDSIALRE